MKNMFLGLMTIISAFGCSKGKEAISRVQWPELSAQSFIQGRAANDNDARNGKAAFVLNSEGQSIGNPMNIAIPQYAYFVDKTSGGRTPCIVIQAEFADDKQYIGAYDFRKKTHIVGFWSDFIMLGHEPEKYTK